MNFKLLLNIAAVTSIFALSGCELLNEGKDPISEEEKEFEKNRPGAIITVNKIIKERSDKKNEIMIPSYWNRSKELCVDRNSLLTPKGIESIERIPNDKVANSYDLIIKLSTSGLMKYDIIFTAYRNTYLALLIDGSFYKTIKMARMIDTSENKILIPGPFSDELSKKIVEKAEVNYNYYNGIKKESFLDKLLKVEEKKSEL